MTIVFQEKKILNCKLLTLHNNECNSKKPSNGTIKQHIKFKTLIQFLNGYEIFTDNEMEYFTCKYKLYNSSADKVNNLIEWLKHKDDNGIINFVKALDEANKHSGQNATLKKLHETLFLATVKFSMYNTCIR